VLAPDPFLPQYRSMNQRFVRGYLAERERYARWLRRTKHEDCAASKRAYALEQVARRSGKVGRPPSFELVMARLTPPGLRRQAWLVAHEATRAPKPDPRPPRARRKRPKVDFVAAPEGLLDVRDTERVVETIMRNERSADALDHAESLEDLGSASGADEFGNPIFGPPA
jgi:hypothetical protein